MTTAQQIQNLPDTQTFENVTLYRKNEFFGNINRLDVKRVRVERTRYAQYDNALKVIYRAPRKRKDRYFFVYGDFAFLAIVPTADAITPQDLFGPAEVSPTGAIVRQGRYSSFDHRFVTEFTENLDASKLLVFVEGPGR